MGKKEDGVAYVKYHAFFLFKDRHIGRDNRMGVFHVIHYYFIHAGAL